LANRRLLIIILVSCLLIVCLYMGIDYIRQKKTQNELTGQIKTASQTLNLVVRPVEDLSARLSEIEQQYQTAALALSTSEVNATDIVRAVYQAADELKLKTGPFSTGPWSKKTIEGSVYRVMSVGLKIEGHRSAFSLFLKQLENRKLFPCLAIESLSITDENGINKIDATSDDAVNISAEMNIIIFSRLEAVK
jgi:hypothetical protein